MKRKYINLVEDIMENDYIAPLKLLKDKDDWICYCGEDIPTVQLKELIVITFTVLDTIKIKKIDNLTYEKLMYYCFEDYSSNGFYSNILITTEGFDFICFIDDDTCCFSICGEKELVEKSFLGRTYEMMKMKYIKKAKNISLNNFQYRYRMKFYEYYINSRHN